MKSAYELANTVCYRILWAARDNETSQDIAIKYEKPIRESMLSTTPAGRPHYTQADRAYVSGAINAAHDMVRGLLCIHGYWYKGEFYGTCDKSKQLGYKTTSILHDQKLPMDVWDSMESGFYYADTLKPYFIGNNGTGE